MPGRGGRAGTGTRPSAPSWMRLELELGDDPEVAAASAESPQQLGVALLVGAEHGAVRRDELDADEVVARQPPLAPHPAETAAEGQPGDARVADHAARDDEAVRLRRCVEVLEGGATARTDPPGRRVDRDVAHRGEVDDKPFVDRAEAGDVVAAAAHGERDAGLARDAEGRDDVPGPAAARDCDGMEVDHAVPHAARLVVGLVTGANQLAGQRRGELVEHGGQGGVRGRGHRLSSLKTD